MTAINCAGNEAAATPGQLVLLRHGQTVWSVSGQHTGRTDIPLTPAGQDQAEQAGERLCGAFPDGFAAGHVFVSPLRRARQTAALAGYPQATVLDDLAEWDLKPINPFDLLEDFKRIIKPDGNCSHSDCRRRIQCNISRAKYS